jgi:putative peptide zinc metalloprotease protein
VTDSNRASITLATSSKSPTSRTGALADLDFIDAIDHHLLPEPDPRPPSLQWQKPRHARWTLHPATAVAASMIIVVGIGCLAARPDLVPTYRSLVWSHWSGIVLAGDMVIAWVLIFLHEFSRLATARGAGVPARLSLGTRLQFLTAQTDVTGVWTQQRRIRLTVYLAGIVVDLVTAGLGLTVLVSAGSAMPAIASRIIEATILLAPAMSWHRHAPGQDTARSQAHGAADGAW